MPTFASTVLLAVLLLAHHPTASDAGWLGMASTPRRARRGKPCHRTSHEYRPSPLETMWANSVRVWGQSKDYCKIVGRFRPNITYWLQANADLMAGQQPQLRDPKGNDVFSSFISTYTCRDGTTHTRTSWIEPLAFALRHPVAPCNKTAIEDRTYLLLGSASDYKPHPRLKRSGSGSSCTPHTGPRAYLFDLGASTWSKGFGGPSQSFIISAYETRGIKFDRILLWEATPYTSEEIYAKVPRELHAVYQYINIPVNVDRADPANPLNILKQIASCEDYVVLKLDIDTPHLENDLIAQILEDPEISRRIDEFYFEQHVNFAPMLPNWKLKIDRNKTLLDSYQLFQQLRKRGIRAHGWP